MLFIPVVEVLLSIGVKEALFKVILLLNQLLGLVVKQVAVDCQLDRTSMMIERINDTTGSKLSFKKPYKGSKSRKFRSSLQEFYEPDLIA